MSKISYSGYRFPPEIIQQAIWLYARFTLSFRDVEDLLAERGIIVSYETVGRWVNHFGSMIATEERAGQARGPWPPCLLGLTAKSSAKCRWHDRIFFFTHAAVRVPPAYQVRLRTELPAPTSARASPAEILARAAYSQRRSSNANSLRGAVPAKSPKVMAPIQMDSVPDGFRSSSLITPASQSGLRHYTRRGLGNPREQNKGTERD